MCVRVIIQVNVYIHCFVTLLNLALRKIDIFTLFYQILSNGPRSIYHYISNLGCKHFI